MAADAPGSEPAASEPASRLYEALMHPGQKLKPGARVRFESNVGFKSPGFDTNDLGFIRRADQILVYQGGRIVERGNHATLLRKGGLYARLYREQFASETPSSDHPHDGVAGSTDSVASEPAGSRWLSPRHSDRR